MPPRSFDFSAFESSLADCLSPEVALATKTAKGSPIDRLVLFVDSVSGDAPHLAVSLDERFPRFSHALKPKYSKSFLAHYRRAVSHLRRAELAGWGEGVADILRQEFLLACVSGVRLFIQGTNQSTPAILVADSTDDDSLAGCLARHEHFEERKGFIAELKRSVFASAKKEAVATSLAELGEPPYEQLFDFINRFVREEVVSIVLKSEAANDCFERISFRLHPLVDISETGRGPIAFLTSREGVARSVEIFIAACSLARRKARVEEFMPLALRVEGLSPYPAEHRVKAVADLGYGRNEGEKTRPILEKAAAFAASGTPFDEEMLYRCRLGQPVIRCSSRLALDGARRCRALDRYAENHQRLSGAPHSTELFHRKLKEEFPARLIRERAFDGLNFSADATVDFHYVNRTRFRLADGKPLQVEPLEAERHRLLRTRSPRDPEALLSACRAGDLEEIELLVASGAALDVRDDEFGESLLHAVLRGADGDGDVERSNVVGYLLSRGLDPNSTASPEETPLELAVATGSVMLTKLLLDAGAEVNTRPSEDDDHRTPLLMALRKRRVQVVRLLLEHGADPNGVAGKGKSLLAMVASSGDVEAFELLIAHGASISAGGPKSPLAAAYLHGQDEIVERLSRHGLREPGTLGIAGYQPDALDEAYLRIGAVSGVVVMNIVVGSAADRLHLKPDDLITEVEGHPVGKFSDLSGALSGKLAGERVRVSYRRGHDVSSEEVMLGPRIPGALKFRST